MSPRLDPIPYLTHGAFAAAAIMKGFHISLEEMAQSSLLDYGCGAGRISRVLSFFFERVVGYDPNEDAIRYAKTDCPPQSRMKFKNLSYTTTPPTEMFDYVIAVSVLTHLEKESGLIAWNNILKCTRKAASIHTVPVRNNYLPVPYVNPQSDCVEILIWKPEGR